MNVIEKKNPTNQRAKPPRRPAAPPVEKAVDQQIAEMERTFTVRWEW